MSADAFSKQELLNAGGREKWIEMQRSKGVEKRAERDALKNDGDVNGNKREGG